MMQFPTMKKFNAQELKEDNLLVAILCAAIFDFFGPFRTPLRFFGRPLLRLGASTSTVRICVAAPITWFIYAVSLCV